MQRRNTVYQLLQMFGLGAGADQAAGHRFGNIARRFARQQGRAAAVDKSLTLLGAKGFKAFVRVHQGERCNPVWVQQSGAHRNTPAHGQAHQMRAGDAKVVQHPQHVMHKIIKR